MIWINEQWSILMIGHDRYLCLSICKRCKKLVECRPPKKAVTDDTKSICRPCKKYCRQYKKVLAGDTKSICRWYREPTRRDDNPRSGVCVHNRLPRGRSVFWFVERLFVSFPCVFFCNPGKHVYILVYRLPPQFLVARQSLLFAV